MCVLVFYFCSSAMSPSILCELSKMSPNSVKFQLNFATKSKIIIHNFQRKLVGLGNRHTRVGSGYIDQNYVTKCEYWIGNRVFNKFSSSLERCRMGTKRVWIWFWKENEAVSASIYFPGGNNSWMFELVLNYLKDLSCFNDHSQKLCTNLYKCKYID